MQTNELETRIEHMEAVLTDESGALRPIERIDFELVGRQLRWNVWSAGVPGTPGRRLQSITTRIDDIDGLLEASKLLLQVAMADRMDGPAETAEDGESRSQEDRPS